MELACSRRLSCRWGTPARWPGRRRHRADSRPGTAVTCGSGGRMAASASARCRVQGDQAFQVARAASGCQAATPAAPFPARRPGQSLAGWMMIEVFDTTAARCALARRMLRCPDCGQALNPGGGAASAPSASWAAACGRCARTGPGAPAATSPTSCSTPSCCRAAPTPPAIGQALVAAARGRGHRLVARDLDVPPGTVRGWIRRARRSAGQLRAAGVRAVVMLDPDALPARAHPSELACALDALGAAALALGGRFGVQHASPWARVTVLTQGQLLNLSPDG